MKQNDRNKEEDQNIKQRWKRMREDSTEMI